MAEVQNIEGPHVIVRTDYNDHPMQGNRFEANGLSLLIESAESASFETGATNHILKKLQEYHQQGFRVIVSECVQDEEREKIDTLLKQTA